MRLKAMSLILLKCFKMEVCVLHNVLKSERSQLESMFAPWSNRKAAERSAFRSLIMFHCKAEHPVSFWSNFNISKIIRMKLKHGQSETRVIGLKII